MKYPISALLIVVVIFIYSCNKNSPEQPIVPINPPIPPDTTAIDTSPDVYSAGTVYRANSIAAYWKNDSMVELTKGAVNAEATGIAVSGKDVYVSGYYNDGSNTQG